MFFMCVLLLGFSMYGLRCLLGFSRWQGCELVALLAMLGFSNG